tara:strand:+ start:377 stop:577 length:201 start_codon:yes stop_codon:yes gene_type:complete
MSQVEPILDTVVYCVDTGTVLTLDSCILIDCDEKARTVLEESPPSSAISEAEKAGFVECFEIPELY